MFSLEAVKQKRFVNLSAGVLLLHDNEPAHNSYISQATIKDVA